jgi:transposase, IS6 family
LIISCINEPTVTQRCVATPFSRSDSFGLHETEAAGAVQGRHFEAEIIVLCVRWYLRYALSFRNLEEIMAERNLSVDHVTIWRWVQRYAPELNRRCQRELRNTNRSWRVDETYCRVGGKWTYLCRALDSTGATIDFC